MADWVSLFPLIFSRAKIALALAIKDFECRGGSMNSSRWGGGSGEVGIFILTNHTHLGRGLYPPPDPPLD